MKFIMIIYLVLAFSCNGQNGTAKHNVSDTVQKRERPWIEEFSLPYSSDFKTDSSSLIFYYTQSFDTAIVIHLKRESSYLGCIFYWITPQSRLALRGFRNHENELTQFEGLSAKLEVNLWHTVTKEVNKKQFKQEEEQGYLGCCDIPYYFLSYNGQIYFNNNKLNAERLKEVKSLLEEVIIAKLRAIAKGQR